MSQRPTETPDWAATGNQSTPSAGRKSSGWLGATATTPGDKPPAQEFNWFWALVTRWLTWALGYSAQRLDSYERATGYGGPLLISPPQANANEAFILDDYDPDDAPFSTVATIASPVGPVSGLAADGRFLFVAGNTGGDGDVAAFSPLQGAAWDISWLSLTGDNIQALSSSGRHLGVARDVGAAGGAYFYKTIDKAESVSSRAVLANAPVAVDCVGAGMVVVDAAGGWNLGADMTVGTFTGNHGAPLADCCAYDDRAIVVGNHTGGVTSRGFKFSTGTLVWTANRNGGNATACCTDGDFLYEGGAADGAGDYMIVRSLYDGSKLQGVAMAGIAPAAVAVDDRYLYAAQGVELYVLDKRTLGTVKVMALPAAVSAVATDGRNVFASYTSNVRIFQRNELPRTMVYIDPQDTAGVDTLLSNNRKPIHGLILPLGGR